MSTAPDITELRQGPVVEDESGVSAQRIFDVIATGRYSARVKIASAYGITRGCVWRDSDGSVPDALIMCRRITVDRRVEAVGGGQGLYRVTADYKKIFGELNKQPIRGGPPLFSVRRNESFINVDVDYFGDPITNSSDQPYDPPKQRLKAGESVHVEWHLQGTDELQLYFKFRPWAETVNIADYRMAPRGCLLCHGWDFRPDDVAGWFLGVTDLEYRAPKKVFGKTYEGWLDVDIDRGTRVVNADGTYKDILGSDGNPVSDPVYLDGEGQVLANGASPVVNVTQQYGYSDFKKMLGM